MDNNNCYLLLGQTGVGKSTLIKILSGNESIKIGHGKQSETQDVQSYNCSYEDFNYTLIDTPGYDDSNGNDPKNYAHIKQIIGSGTYKIKGIILLLSFQDARFGESHRKGLNKIVNLFPLDNFWDYIIIVFTKTFCDEDEDIEELKENTLKEYKPIFDVLISAYNRTKNVKKVDFSSIKNIFINSKIKKNKIDNVKNLIETLKENSKLDPFFHRMEVKEKNEQLMIINKLNKNLGDLYDVKYKVYDYYNNNEESVKTISRPVEKEFIKQIKKTEYDGKFQQLCAYTGKLSSNFGLLGVVGAFALSSFCPAISLSIFTLSKASISISYVGLAAALVKNTTEYLSNKEFNEQKVIEEILIEEEENL